MKANHLQADRILGRWVSYCPYSN